MVRFAEPGEITEGDFWHSLLQGDARRDFSRLFTMATYGNCMAIMISNHGRHQRSNCPTLKFGSVQNVVNHKGVERINQKTRLAVGKTSLCWSINEPWKTIRYQKPSDRNGTRRELDVGEMRPRLEQLCV